jgi:putative glutamine amidotransferase
MKTCFLASWLIILLPWLSLADVELLVWQAEPQAPRIILPKKQQESPEQAVGRYVHRLNNDPGLASLRPQNPLNFRIGKFELLTAEKTSGPVRMAFIANWMDDLSTQGARIQRNLKAFSKAGADPYVIGLSADLGLNPEDAQSFRDKVARNFSLLVSLGGDDIAPEVYGEELTHSRRTNAIRDRSEFLLVQNFKNLARGIFFGICRGHQMGAIADGHSLRQDLSATGAGTTDHHINLKGSNTSEMQTWHHIYFEDSLLARFLLGKIKPGIGATYKAQVNSVHHQVVDPKDTAASKVVALDDRDATVEALQGHNRKSFSVQFHPEFPSEISGNREFSNRGFQILKGIVSYSRMNRIKSCSRVHRL